MKDLRKPLRQESLENALEQLRNYDTVFVVDDSLSMDEFGKWQEVRPALISEPHAHTLPLSGPASDRGGY
jgi:hypothetical protein